MAMTTRLPIVGGYFSSAERDRVRHQAWLDDLRSISPHMRGDCEPDVREMAAIRDRQAIIRRAKQAKAEKVGVKSPPLTSEEIDAVLPMNENARERAIDARSLAGRKV